MFRRRIPAACALLSGRCRKAKPLCRWADAAVGGFKSRSERRAAGKPEELRLIVLILCNGFGEIEPDRSERR